MFTDSPAFNGFSCDDIPAAKQFYEQTLGLSVAEDDGMLTVTFADGHTMFIYPKPDHQAATYTVLNFPVPDIDAAVAELRSKGIELLEYPDTDNGIQRGWGPPIAWFTDPAGNILSVLEQPGNSA